MSSYKVQPPDLDSCKSFDVYLTKLTVWEATTPAPEESRGAIIASSLPNNSSRYKKDLQDKFYEQVDGLALVRTGGVKLVRDFLVKELGEEDLDKMVRVWDEFENCRRGDTSVVQFLDSFERCYNAVMAISQSARIPAEIRAFMVLKRAGVNDTQRMLVLSKLDMSNKAQMFDNMVKQIKLVLGGGPGITQVSGDAFKVEPSRGEETLEVELESLDEEGTEASTATDTATEESSQDEDTDNDSDVPVVEENVPERFEYNENLFNDNTDRCDVN